MGARYLTDLADVLRAAGLTVREVSGWERRGRSTGGYAEGAPSSYMLHHTASRPASDGANDVSYIISGSPVAPIANIYTDRSGVIWVCAAGATNTNGSGADTWGGGVPANRMNEYAIGNEIANDGIGEPYPQAQQDAVMRSTVAICDHYGIPTNNVRGHFEWTSRKIDPSGPSKWAPYGGKWAMQAFRRDVVDALTAPPVQPPPPEDDDMAKIAYYVLPPAGYPAGSPQFVVIDGNARYRTNGDTPGLIPDVVLPSDQYDNLRASLDVS